MIFPISENDIFIPLLNSHILVSPPTVFSFYVVVGDGPVEQEDQQDENQNGFGKLLIKKQAFTNTKPISQRHASTAELFRARSFSVWSEII